MQGTASPGKFRKEDNLARHAARTTLFPGAKCHLAHPRVGVRGSALGGGSEGYAPELSREAKPLFKTVRLSVDFRHINNGAVSHGQENWQMPRPRIVTNSRGTGRVQPLC